MATTYADRAFLTMNGAFLSDVESANLKQSDGTREVPTMSPDRRNKGFVRGNRNIDLSIVVAVQNKLARAKLENVDYENNDIGLSFQVGADVYQVKGLMFVDVSDDASGVGSEVKSSFNMKALDVIDTVGNSVLFNLST